MDFPSDLAVRLHPAPPAVVCNSLPVPALLPLDDTPIGRLLGQAQSLTWPDGARLPTRWQRFVAACGGCCAATAAVDQVTLAQARQVAARRVACLQDLRTEYAARFALTPARWPSRAPWAGSQLLGLTPDEAGALDDASFQQRVGEFARVLQLRRQRDHALLSQWAGQPERPLPPLRTREVLQALVNERLEDPAVIGKLRGEATRSSIPAQAAQRLPRAVHADLARSLLQDCERLADRKAAQYRCQAQLGATPRGPVAPGRAPAPAEGISFRDAHEAMERLVLDFSLPPGAGAARRIEHKADPAA